MFADGLGDKAVAHAAHSEKMARLGRIFFDVFAQAHDEIVDGARVGVFGKPPDVFENGFARDVAAFVVNQVTKQLRFHQRQPDRVALGAEFERAEVDCLSLEGNRFALARRI